MCGIIGYFGPQPPKDIILSGLKKLEYRGYDSAGIAIMTDHLEVVRSPGKLSNLENALGSRKMGGHMGMGHTRWATHGPPTEKNAHPHKVGSVAIIHNGIIENYLSIREKLVKSGAKILSDTDSELVAHLIDQKISSGKGLLESVVETLPELSGAYSILVASEKNPDEIVAFKNGTPMVVGIGRDEIFVASDVQAFVEHTKKVVYLEDGEIALTHKATVKFFDKSGRAIEKVIKEIKWDAQTAQKQGFAHFMQKEIFEQPRAIIHTLEPHLVHLPPAIKMANLGLSDEYLRGIDKLYLVACGTSSYAALYAKYVIERLAGVACEVDLASEFRYREPVMTEKTLVLVISQSGETADTLAALRLARSRGVKVLSIVNVQESSIDRESDGHLYTLAGLEIGVASTKAFTAQMSLLCAFAAHVAGVRGSGAASKSDISDLVKALMALPSQVEFCLNHDKWFSEAADTLKNFKGFLYIGRGVNYPIALEGALKLKEISYLHAEGYAAGELKHGPIALVDDKMATVVIAPKDHVYEKTVSNLQEVKARGGKIISIGTEGDHELEKMSEHFLALPKAHWATNPILAAIPVQLLSYHVAVSLGRDVDQPRNLAKSVTVE